MTVTEDLRTALSQSFAPFLWSYDLEALDTQKNKKRIITAVLNLGTEQAVKDLFRSIQKRKSLMQCRLPFMESGARSHLHFVQRFLIFLPNFPNDVKLCNHALRYSRYKTARFDSCVFFAQGGFLCGGRYRARTSCGASR